MSGNKACFIDDLAAQRGVAYTRFDYRGHGASAGHASTLGIGHWLADTLAVIDRCETPVLLIGSSMGAWLSVLAAERRSQKVVGLLTIAAAPDFVTELLQDSLSEDEQRAAAAGQMAWRASEHSDTPWPIPPVLIDSGPEHRVLTRTDILGLEATLIHGTADESVPFSLSERLRQQRLPAHTPLVEIAGGDHRLSDAASLAVIERELDRLMGRIRRRQAALD